MPNVSPNQTLIILTNCPKYTKKILAMIILIRYESSIRKEQKYSSLPPFLQNIPSLRPLFSTDSRLEFSAGERFLGMLTDCFNGAIHYSGENKSSHKQNYHECIRILLLNAKCEVIKNI